MEPDNFDSYISKTNVQMPNSQNYIIQEQLQNLQILNQGVVRSNNNHTIKNLHERRITQSPDQSKDQIESKNKQEKSITNEKIKDLNSSSIDEISIQNQNYRKNAGYANQKNKSFSQYNAQDILTQRKQGFRIIQSASKRPNYIQSNIYNIAIETRSPSKKIYKLQQEQAELIKQLEKSKQAYRDLRNQRLKIGKDDKNTTNESVFEFCLRTNKSRLKYPELAVLLQKLESKQNTFRMKRKKSVQIQTIDEDQIYKNPKFKVQLKDMKFPQLPKPPNKSMKSKELKELGKKIFEIFEIYKRNESGHIIIQKYRNCVHFSDKQVHVLWYDTGRFYIGDYMASETTEGQKHGYGIELLPGKSIYEGEFKLNKKNGFGKLKFENNSYYEGQFENGLQHGKGNFFQNSELIYEGEWKQGLITGYGRLRLKNGQYYEGYLQKGIQNGYGTLIFQNRDQYKGNFVQGKFHGTGNYFWSTGEIYQGEFENGLRHGTGKWKCTRPDGKTDQYCGQYKNDKKSGMGKYTWNQETSYEGQFENDQRHGVGIMQDKQKSFKALWQNGIVKKILIQNLRTQQTINSKRIQSAKVNHNHVSLSISRPKEISSARKIQRSCCTCKHHNGQKSPNNKTLEIKYRQNLKSESSLQKINRKSLSISKSKQLREQPYKNIQQSTKLNNLYS